MSIAHDVAEIPGVRRAKNENGTKLVVEISVLEIGPTLRAINRTVPLDYRLYDMEVNDDMIAIKYEYIGYGGPL